MPSFEFATIVEVISGLLILIFAIYKAIFGLLSNTVLKEWKKKRERQQQQQTLEVLEASFTEHLKPLNDNLDTLRVLNELQDEKIDKLVCSSNDLLRKDITTIYYKHLPYKRLPRYVREQLSKLYEDYKRQNGNSFIDEIYAIMKTWDVVETKEEVKERKS